MSVWSDVSVFTTITKPSPSPTDEPISGSDSESELSPTPSSLGTPKLSEPRSTGSISTQPIFKWNSVSGAERYDLLVSKDDQFLNLVVNKTGINACSANAWKCDVILEYSTSYYWKVRAIGKDEISAWSDVSIFTTEAAPSISPSTVSPTPASSGKMPTVSPAPNPNLSPTAINRSSNSKNMPDYSGVISSVDQPEVNNTPSTPTPTSSPVSEIILSGSIVWQLLIIFGSLIVGIGILIFGVAVILRKFIH